MVYVTQVYRHLSSSRIRMELQFHPDPARKLENYKAFDTFASKKDAHIILIIIYIEFPARRTEYRRADSVAGRYAATDVVRSRARTAELAALSVAMSQ
jgi:hypothetical protein